ncbi:lipocalin family protein [Albibacterium indicum]|uniref:lipocalin family protein n=1 Tax=Albibacterium indicum TaxID=2292082 RepID=UPI000E5298FD|nr:lipocalin family protein [Pedobacter indicus]
MNKKITIAGTAAALASLGAVVAYALRKQMPEKAQPIENFDLERYLGVWYEVARIDFRFEKNLDNVSAEYTLREDGLIKVVNKGYNFKKQKWQSVEGKAKFWDDENMAALRVSFFGPFYSGYNVVAIDEHYLYALVAGRNLNYLWILSRNMKLPDDIKRSYVRIAKAIGYDTSRLVWGIHDKG